MKNAERKRRKKGEKKEDIQQRSRSRSGLCRHSENEGESRLTGRNTFSVAGLGSQGYWSGIVRNGKMCDRIANKRDEWSMNAGTRICWTKRSSSKARHISFRGRIVRGEDVAGNETNVANVSSQVGYS